MTARRGVRVVVAEDEQLILANTVKKIHAVDPVFEVIGAAEDGKSALDLIETTYPDLLVSDIRMPPPDGLELARLVAQYHPYMKTIIVSGYDDFEYARTAIRYGVKRYLLKPLRQDELCEALRDVRISLEEDDDLLEGRLRGRGEPIQPDHLVEEVESFLRQNHGRKIDLEAVARGFSMSSSQLCRLWKRVRGDTPVRYLKLLRMNEAKHLLVERDELDVKLVGELVGYPDPFYFSRVFKTATGRSPTEFRSQNRATRPA